MKCTCMYLKHREKKTREQKTNELKSTKSGKHIESNQA